MKKTIIHYKNDHDIVSKIQKESILFKIRNNSETIIFHKKDMDNYPHHIKQSLEKYNHIHDLKNLEGQKLTFYKNVNFSPP